MDNSQQLITGESPALQEVMRSASLVAATDVTVLVTGETGTGKELMARYIHARSPREGSAFVAVNCSALPEALAESLLFGHKKGAFTDAIENNQGYVAEAEHGTLFLDEVGELPLSVQAKLLRFLENGECQPPGYSRTIRYDVRVVAATNRDLMAEVEAGRFREDLFYRLNIVPLELPSLRRRSGDVRLLLDSILLDLAVQHRLLPPRFTRAALKVLEQYHWPGNVRELRNFCERMLILFNSREVDVTNLPAEILKRPERRHSGFQLPKEGIELESLEIELIDQALEYTRGNKTQAARLLGLTRDTLKYRIKKYAIAGD
ncbi:MAG: sigma-54 interaction domain-containing protein [Thiotrichales bacterium]